MIQIKCSKNYQKHNFECINWLKLEKKSLNIIVQTQSRIEENFNNFKKDHCKQNLKFYLPASICILLFSFAVREQLISF